MYTSSQMRRSGFSKRLVNFKIFVRTSYENFVTRIIESQVVFDVFYGGLVERFAE